MPHELKLSKKQFNALVRDVHKDMMKGSGLTDGTYAAPPTIPEFSGPDLSFFVEDSGMEEVDGATRSVPYGPALRNTYCLLPLPQTLSIRESQRANSWLALQRTMLSAKH